jgi:LmbE family N-acetylglucosaminyl deacetylase
VRAAEARRSAEAFLAGVAKTRIVTETYRDGFFPYEGGAVKELFERLKGEVSPDLILTHRRGDLHQDHRIVSELTWNTFRDHLILEYEVPKYDGDLGAPNFFVHLDDETCNRKTTLLLKHFPSQLGHRWFTEDLFRSLLRLRGMESNAPSGKAEAFYSHKAVW